MNLAAVGHDQADALAAVMGGAAAQGDQGVAFFLLVNIDAVMDVFVRGVRDGFVVYFVLHSGSVQQVGDLLGQTATGDTLIGDDQRLAAAQGLDLLGNLLGSANTDQSNAGNEETVNHFLNSHDCTSLKIVTNEKDPS
ncbi:hypothetical protein DSECCO2_614140 [anaerobic digester metagenome]